VANPSFEEVDHTADWALRVRGRDFPDLLRNASVGMLELAGIVADQGPGIVEDLTLNAPDREGLLVAWLEEVLYRVESRGLAVESAVMDEAPSGGLRARLTLQPVVRAERTIKAVTYHNLVVQRTSQGWEATVVFDV
jgi:SHS2 domain-containing protein